MIEYDDIDLDEQEETPDDEPVSTRVIIEASDFKLTCPQCEALIPELVINRRWAFDFDCPECSQPLTLSLSLDC